LMSDQPGLGVGNQEWVSTAWEGKRQVHGIVKQVGGPWCQEGSAGLRRKKARQVHGVSVGK
jgi:hypothetical protein